MPLTEFLETQFPDLQKRSCYLLGMGWGGRWEAGLGWDGGTHVHPWLIHVNVWQKPSQNCKIVSLQLNKFIFFNGNA